MSSIAVLAVLNTAIGSYSDTSQFYSAAIQISTQISEVFEPKFVAEMLKLLSLSINAFRERCSRCSLQPVECFTAFINS